MKRALIIAGIALSWLLQAASAQDAPAPPPCNPYVLQKVVNDNPVMLQPKQRWCIYSGSVFSGQAIFGPAFMAGVAQFRDDPVEWGQGTKGYLRRFGTRYAQGATKTTASSLVGWMLHEDPRYQVSTQKGFWHRTGHALSTVFLAQRLHEEQFDSHTRSIIKTHLYPNFANLSGAVASGTVGLAWYPDRLNTPGQVLARTGSAYGGYVSSAIFNEFKADIFHLLANMLGSDRGSTSLPKEGK